MSPGSRQQQKKMKQSNSSGSNESTPEQPNKAKLRPIEMLHRTRALPTRMVSRLVAAAAAAKRGGCGSFKNW